MVRAVAGDLLAARTQGNGFGSRRPAVAGQRGAGSLAPPSCGTPRPLLSVTLTGLIGVRPERQQIMITSHLLGVLACIAVCVHQRPPTLLLSPQLLSPHSVPFPSHLLPAHPTSSLPTPPRALALSRISLTVVRSLPSTSPYVSSLKGVSRASPALVLRPARHGPMALPS